MSGHPASPRRQQKELNEYRDAQPAGWLIWTAGGALGAKRYACVEHRRDLIAHVRRIYGTSRTGVWQDEPYPSLWPDGVSGFDERELAQLLDGDDRERPGHALDQPHSRGA